tara:strand:+ start:1092 stop:1790 length:699 start_codon:yes stop_codon:yes gene_type:complete
MEIDKNNIKFFSVVSGLDKNYLSIKNNFQQHLKKINILEQHEVIKTNTHSGNWQEKGFINTVYKKLDYTREFLKKGRFVFCTDLDIVYLKDPIPYLIEQMEINNYDILFQHDYAKDGDKIFSVYCTGFYLVRPTKINIKLFDLSYNFFKRSNKIIFQDNEEKSDQNYINTKLKQKRFRNLKIGLLDKNLFPNGWCWKKYNTQIDPFIIHYNCIEGGIEGKIKEMKKFKHWIV